jgi:Ca-activated chloride channel family protein
MPAIVLALLLCLYRFYQQRRSIYKLVAGRTELLINFSRIKFIIKQFLLISAFFALGLALMRPATQGAAQEIDRKGRDIIIALDVSRSMNATDCLPNRLAAAREKIKHLIDLDPSARVGLLLFSGDASMQCPLTDDHDVFKLFLDMVGSETVSSGTTCLSRALEKIVGHFSEHDATRSKLVVLVTDGEDFSGSLDVVKKQLQDLDIRLCIMGVATPDGAPIPLQEGYQLDSSGNIVISCLNEPLLKAVANECHGVYMRITPDSTDVRRIFDYIQHFEQEYQKKQSLVILDEKYCYGAGLALALLIIEWLL